MLPQNLWIGAGVKYGGTLGIIGAENIYGGIVRMSEPRRIWGVGSSGPSLRVGLGLGGGIQVVGLFFLNCPNPQNVNMSDWGIDFAVGERWSSFVSPIATSIRNERVGVAFVRLAIRLARRNIGPNDVSTLRDFGHILTNTYDSMGGRDGREVAIALDLPGLGAGAAAAITYTFASRLNVFGPPINI